jgi:hypothetical protein
VWWNITFAWYLPNPVIGFKYYLDVFQATAFWPMIYLPLALMLPLIALGTAWAARRVTGG